VAIRIQQSIVDASRIYIARINNITSILPTLIIPSLIYSIPYLQDKNAIIASFDISQFFSIDLYTDNSAHDTPNDFCIYNAV
jgi:hypothetical protein